MRKIERRKWDADTRHISTKIRFQTSPHFSIFMKFVDFFIRLEYLFYFWIFPDFLPLVFVIACSVLIAAKKNLTFDMRAYCMCVSGRARVCDRWWSHGQLTDETGVSYVVHQKSFKSNPTILRRFFFLLVVTDNKLGFTSSCLCLFCFPFDFCFDAVPAPTTAMVAHRQRLTCADNVYEHPILTSWWMHLLCMHIYFGCCTTKWNFRSATTTKVCERLRRLWRMRYGSSRCNDLTTAMTPYAEWIICIRQILVDGNLFCVFRKYSHSCFASYTSYDSVWMAVLSDFSCDTAAWIRQLVREHVSTTL